MGAYAVPNPQAIFYQQYEATRRDEVVAALAAAGVRTDVHYPIPDHLQPAFAHEFANVSLPVTEETAPQLISLPCFPELTEAEVEQVCDALRSL